ncbi:MAG: hypothetical protein H7123_01520, partial [Thermoleophilia bacterium]|nr:hypothetical protein [Thermoleophilia bacterium]
MLTDQPLRAPGALMVMGSSLLIAGRLQRGSVTVVDGRITEVFAETLGNGKADENDDVAASNGVRDLQPVSDDTVMIDLGDQPICPAPIDLHFHGAGGVSVPPIGDVGKLDEALGTLLAATTWARDVRTGRELDARLQPYRYLATLPVPSDPPVDIVAHVVEAAQAVTLERYSRCAGLRIEGLFLNTARAGVWPPATFRLPDIELLDELID